MNNQLDLATLALKGKRYSEAENIYMQIVGTDNSVEAWCGVGICKLYQLTENRTMDEVIFCFEKAKQASPNLHKEIEEQLIIHSGIVLTTYTQLIQSAAQQAAKEKGKAQLGAALAAVSFIGGMNSSKAFSTIAALGGTGAGVGVAVDSLNKINDLKVLSRIILSKCNEIYNAVNTFCAKENQAAIEFENKIETLRKNLNNILSSEIQEQSNGNQTKTTLFLIFCFPYGLYLMWKNKVWSNQTRWIITAVFILLFVIAALNDKK